MSYTALQRSAILMMAIGEDAAAEVFKNLSTTEVQDIGKAMSELKQVSRADLSEVLEAFRMDAEQFEAISFGADSYIRAVLTKALGEERAAGVIEDILDIHPDNSGVDALNAMDSQVIAELVRNEHPQIVATILVHLSRERASEVLAMLPERLRDEVVMRIATFGGVQPAALNALTEVLDELFAGQSTKRSRMGGVRAAAEILNMMPSSQESATLESMRANDADLAQKIEDEMFVFENLIDVEDRGIQMLLKDINSDALMIALKGADEALREKFLRNMSTRQAEMLREDMEASGPIRLSQVEAEQKTILMVARRLAETGEIVLGNKGDDAYV